MSPLLMAALVAVLAIQPSLPISSGETYTVREERMVGSQKVVTETVYTAFMTCEDGRVTRLVHNGRLGSFLHEVLHAASCVLTGEMKGGLLPYPPKTDDPEHEWVAYCLDNEVKCIEILEAAR